MGCGCSNPDNPKTYKNTFPPQETLKKGTVGEYWQGHPLPPSCPKK